MEVDLRAGQTVNIPVLGAYIAALGISVNGIEYLTRRQINGVWTKVTPYVLIHANGLTGFNVAAIQDALTIYTVTS